MTPLYLTSGAYSSRSVIANAQRCVNLFMEKNPAETKPPTPTTHYPRPGKKQWSVPPAQGVGRGMYRATNGDLYAVVNDVLYFVDNVAGFHAIGNIGAGTSIVSMADNGQDVGDDMVVVDGSANGWVVTMSTRAFNQIVDGTGTFVGSNRVDYLQSFFLFNAPGTPQWYTSLSNSVTFSGLDIATKASYADNIKTLGVRQREVWLIGELSTEPWYLSGAFPFPFEAVPTTFVPHGTPATYSMASIGVSLFWLSQDLRGSRIAVRTKGYAAERISTHALEDEWRKYPTVADVVASSFQLDGHTFWVLNFPSANKTWAFDLITEQWAQWTWLDNDGVENRDRAMFYAHAYDMVLGQDWQTGVIYSIDLDTYQDNGQPILCRRGFPHVLSGMNRVSMGRLVADMECGTIADQTADPQLMLRISDDRGKTFSDPISTSMGKTGEYQTSPQFTQLGTARDRVVELSWAENMKTALNGVYLDDLEEAET